MSHKYVLGDANDERGWSYEYHCLWLLKDIRFYLRWIWYMLCLLLGMVMSFVVEKVVSQ